MGIINDNFIIKNEVGKVLYSYAADMPIVDYHCHISPKEIYENKQFRSITEVWLGGDHYKWRLLRANGVPEEEVTGGADDFTKFLRFAEVLEKCIGNPMYHWCHLELKRYFGFDGALKASNAREVYDFCNEQLKKPELFARGIIEQSNVRMIGTTDDPVDDLKWHKLIAADDSFKTAVYPSFRPDKALAIEKPEFATYIEKLAKAAEMPIKSADDVEAALGKRLAFFVSLGCRATDHGLDHVVYSPASKEKVNGIFAKAMKGEKLSAEEIDEYKTDVMLYLAKEISKHGIVMQLHFSAMRNPNSRQFAEIGPDTGFDCIEFRDCGDALAAFLNALDSENCLPKTIIYSLNPNDNLLIDTIAGSFQGVGVKNKIQHGAAWWYNDTKSGMEAQMKNYANVSVLGNFIGMLTDSRSFLSYTRHEYFRRILCNMIGEWVEEGEYPADFETLRKLVCDISYNNAAEYFGI